MTKVYNNIKFIVNLIKHSINQSFFLNQTEKNYKSIHKIKSLSNELFNQKFEL